MATSETAGFVHFADIGDLAAARIAAAVLADAGIEARLHGESLGPYPVTIGRLAITQVWVHADDVDDARLIMLEAEIDHMLGAESEPESDERVPTRVGALAIAAVLVYAVVRGLMRVF